MGRDCGNQSDMQDVLTDLLDMGSDAIFAVAEDLIVMDYSRVQVVPPLALFPSKAPDETCVFVDPSVGSSQAFVRYLELCNPTLNSALFNAMINAKGLGFQVPDIMMHRPAWDVFEYYEIKPNTSRQQSKGSTKLQRIFINL